MTLFLDIIFLHSTDNLQSARKQISDLSTPQNPYGLRDLTFQQLRVSRDKPSGVAMLNGTSLPTLKESECLQPQGVVDFDVMLPVEDALYHCTALKMNSLQSFETSVSVYQST